MLNQIKCMGSWVGIKLNNRLGQRGAEMVEYAIVLACIAAVGVYFYGTQASADNSLNGILKTLWSKINTIMSEGTTVKK